MDIDFLYSLNSTTVVAQGEKLGRNVEGTFTGGQFEPCTVMVCFFLSSLEPCAVESVLMSFMILRWLRSHKEAPRSFLNGCINKHRRSLCSLRVGVSDIRVTYF
jgi:hypothetical protein